MYFKSIADTFTILIFIIAYAVSAERSSVKENDSQNNGKIPSYRPNVSPLPVIRNAPFVYRGQVFIVQETNDNSEPYIAQIVEGGIEMVQPNLKPFRKPPTMAATSESFPDIHDDPEYFAVLVTPETVAQAQISRTTTIAIPLPMLLLAVSSRIPWVMVLKRQNHFDYFRNLTPVQIPLPQRRRNRSHKFPNARLLTESRKYDLVYTKDDTNMMNSICASIVQELFYLNAMLQNQSNEAEPYNLESSDELVDGKKETATNLKNETEDSNDAVPTDEQSLEKLFQVMSAMMSNSTQITSESPLLIQKQKTSP